MTKPKRPWWDSAATCSRMRESMAELQQMVFRTNDGRRLRAVAPNPQG
jgi:hypothetical protein